MVVGVNRPVEPGNPSRSCTRKTDDMIREALPVGRTVIPAVERAETRFRPMRVATRNFRPLGWEFYFL